MQITITDTAGTGASLVLVHGPADTGAANYATGPLDQLAWSDENEIQVAPRFRSAWAAVYQRDNKRARVEFVAGRQFATPMEAMAWLANHFVSVPRKDRLTISDGTRVINLKGALGPIRYEPRGVSLTLRYQFTFMEVSVS